ncbi:MAG: ATP-binding protein [Clostridia bacterium]|nr:ATP-binding protein [Clostridia bacterium]
MMQISEIIAAKTEKRIAAIEAAKLKKAEIHSAIPRVKEIDGILFDIPFRAFGGEDIAALRAEAENLNAERERLLTAYGFPAGYDTPAFECPVCNDSGYSEGLKICDCVKKAAAASAGRNSKSLLASGLAEKNFDNFDLAYYSGESLDKMRAVYENCRKYADSFPNINASGILMTGGTGLGKTHLSAAIANAVCDKGYYTVYETAQQIADTFDSVRFNRGDKADKDRYENCELLLIDDLGSECRTNYSVATIANLIDLRMVNGRQTVISTNMSPRDLRKNYGERLFSRLLGEFVLLEFSGEDVRMQKIKGSKK